MTVMPRALLLLFLGLPLHSVEPHWQSGARIAAFLDAAPVARASFWGLRIVDLAQNRVLFEQVVRRLEQHDFVVLTHAQVPANDGGLALGQAAIGAARLIDAEAIEMESVGPNISQTMENGSCASEFQAAS